MGYIRRVTLRCICDDLEEDWGDQGCKRAFVRLLRILKAQEGSPSDAPIADAMDGMPTTVMAPHPLVSSFRAAFGADGVEVQRESISGLHEPHWWKQKASRWRGAATDASVVGDGEVWLCAGGLRRQGDSDDFYAAFMAQVERGGAEAFLPREEDRRLQRVEEKLARREAWAQQVKLSTLICIARAYDATSAELHVPAPSPAPEDAPLVHIQFDIDRVADAAEELVEVLVTVRDLDPTKPKLVQMAEAEVRTVINRTVEDWQVLPGEGTDRIWRALVSKDSIRHAMEARETGELPEALIDAELILGVRAHYAPKDRLVAATIDGEAVRSLCGVWFVPTANPDGLPVCEMCELKHQQIPE